MQLIQIQTTTPSKALAIQIGHRLIEENLAACVQVSDAITSIYSWEGKIEEDIEFRLVIKTIETHFKSVEAVILSLHSYDVPQIIALPIVDGHGAYMEWVRKNTGE